MEKRKILWRLFATFFKIGLFTFGGGYAMLSLIENECVEKKEWITRDELLTVTAIAESTPGPIAINCATYVGWQHGKFLGAVASTVGIVAPSIIVIYLISLFFDNILEIQIIASAFRGIKVAVGVIIINAGVKMLKKMKRTPFSVTVTVLAFAALTVIDIFAVNFSTIWLIVAAGAAGYIAFAMKNRGGEGG